MAYIPDRGDVIWLDFDPTKGSEIQKVRPVIVLSPKIFNQTVKLALVAPVTSTIRGHGFEVGFSGKEVLGAILCQQVRTVDYRVRKARLVEKAPKAVIEDVLGKVRVLVN
jgi:mRNA interferase MazF